MTINEMRDAAHSNAQAKGFWPHTSRLNVAEKLALIHSEVSEALECDREGQYLTTINERGKPEGFPSELADVIIRIGDLAGRLGIDLEWEIKQKMEYNKLRPAKHGKNY